MIDKGQIYQACNPQENGRQIRITDYWPDHGKAHIVSHPSGKNFRQIDVSNLHSKPVTLAGLPRSRGYYLVGRVEAALEESEV